MGKKQALAKCLSVVHFFGVVNRLLLLRLPFSLRILAYHRIWAMSDPFYFDPELVSASEEEFEWQMRYIKKYFEPITFQRLLDALDHGEKIPRNAIIVTFDDGHEDNFTKAFPILDELKIPATIFLSTDYIDTEKVFWFDAVVFALCKTEKRFICLSSWTQTFDRVTPLKGRLDLPNSLEARRKTAAQVLTYLKLVPDLHRRKVIQELFDTVEPEAVPINQSEARALSWLQVKKMHDAGMEFGSHTMSHPILSNLDDQSLAHELTLSKQMIEQKLQCECSVLAYPVGGAAHYDERTIIGAQRAGYKIGVSYVSGVNKLTDCHGYQLKRLHVERYTTRDDFKAMLSIPKIFG